MLVLRALTTPLHAAWIALQARKPMEFQMILKALLACAALVSVASLSVASLSDVARADDTVPAYTMEDVKACSKDALRLCQDKLADLGAIEACMKSKFSELSPLCQTRFKDH